jgi:hypothetical protein
MDARQMPGRSLPSQPGTRGIVNLHGNVVVVEPILQFLHLQDDDGFHLFKRERREHDDLVDAVDELRAEGGFERLVDLVVRFAFGGFSFLPDKKPRVPPFLTYSVPRFEVMIRTVLRKSTTLP